MLLPGLGFFLGLGSGGGGVGEVFSFVDDRDLFLVFSGDVPVPDRCAKVAVFLLREGS